MYNNFNQSLNLSFSVRNTRVVNFGGRHLGGKKLMHLSQSSVLFS